jgi:ABC-type amino acid transport substrate-binding protein
MMLLMAALLPPVTARAELRVTAVAEPWQPYMGPDLPQQGFLVELTQEALARSGYKLDVKFVPWARALLLVKTGEATALLGAYHTSEREEFLAFSDPVTSVQDVLFARKDSAISYRSLEDLEKYKICVVRGAAHGKEFDEARMLHKEQVSNREMCIKMLMAARVDLIVGPEDVTTYILRTSYPDYYPQITALQPPVQTNALYVGFSRNVPDYPLLVAAFNDGLRKLRDDGTLARLAKKHGIALAGRRGPVN